MEFTFCSFTYNQAKDIVIQLNSIKYQIDHYGQNVDCYYLLCDDCSTDDTVDVVNQWLLANGNIFKRTKIIVASENGGIVSNFTTALRNIDTMYFKILAGDDFYYQKNVFEICKYGDFVISPVLYMKRDNTFAKGNSRFIRRLLCCESDSERLRKFLLSQYRFGGGLVAPGVFINKNLVDEGLFNALKPYKWIEDTAEFYYLLSKEGLSICVVNEPYIIYRLGGGYKWKKDNSPMKKEIDKDIELMDKNIHVLRKYWPRFINPFFYWRTFDRLLMSMRKLYKPCLLLKTFSFDYNIAFERRVAHVYINEIIN